MDRPAWRLPFPGTPAQEEIINVGALPKGGRPELDYRTQPHLPEEDDNLARLVVLSACVLAALLALCMHIEPVGEALFGQPGVLLMGGGVGLWAGLALLFTGRVSVNTAARGVGLGFLGGFLLWVMYWACRHFLSLVLGLGIAVALVGYWVDQVMFHYAMWLNANPRLPRETRTHRAHWYRNRWQFQYLTGLAKNSLTGMPGADGYPASAQLVQLRQEEFHDLRSTWFGVGLVLLPYLILPLLPHGLLAATATLLVPPVVAFFSLGVHTTPQVPLSAMLRVAWQAVVSFVTYERPPAPAPGVFHSPAGLCGWRIGLTLAAALFVALALLPLVHFFPVAYELDPWAWKGATLMEPANPVETPAAAAARRVEIREALAPPGSASWYLLALENGESFGFLAAALLGLAATLVFPGLVLGTALVAGAGPFLARAHRALEDPESPVTEQRRDVNSWNAYVTRLAESTDPEEQRHLWLGSSLWHDYPLYLDPLILREHTYIVGDSGSGKTALGILPLVVQLLRQRDPDHASGAAAALVIIDLKGDNTLFQTVRAEAEGRGRPFKYFTNEVGRSTYVFNPLREAVGGELSINQIGETLLEALSLSHGEGYGRSYFSRRARRALTAVLRLYPDIQSFEELYQYTQQEFHNRRDLEDIFELVSVLESLSYYPQLNMHPGSRHYTAPALAHAIHFPAVLENREVIYFWLPAAAEAATVREIAKLAVYSLLSASYRHVRRTGTPSHTYLVIDEFQRMASEGFKIILEQARGFGIGCILANQTFEDLRTHDTDLRHTVQTNTRLKQVFSAADPAHQDALMKTSGEATLAPAWWMLGVDRRQVHRTPRPVVEVPAVTAGGYGRARLTRNQLITVNDDRFASLLQVARGAGLSQFGGFSLPISTRSFIMSAADYERLLGEPWPAVDERTLVIDPADAPPPPEVLETHATSGVRFVDEEPDTDEERAEPSPLNLAAAPAPPTPRRRGRPRKSGAPPEKDEPHDEP
jgi:hypothetical protein